MSTVEFAQAIRAHALRMVHHANASHLGGVFSMADLLAVLYTDVLRVRPAEPKWEDRDRFILSKGHCCSGVYAALALRGFFSLHDLTTYGDNGSLLMTHISHKVPGVEFSTGSLGHGLGFGCGKALAAKRQGKAWRVFVMLSDGELDEGSNWEAILFAAHHGLDNLVVIVDHNRIQSLGRVEEVLRLDPLAAKFSAFNWEVQTVHGHDHVAIRDAMSMLPWVFGKPSVIIADTIKGKGVDFMENELLWHYRTPNAGQLSTALAALGFK